MPESRELLLCLLLLAGPSAAQVPGMCQTEVADRGGEVGCYHLVSTPLPPIPSGTPYWHLYAAPDPGSAHTAARGEAAATVLSSHDKAWLAVIAPKDWHPATPAGTRVALVGPLPVETATGYTARYMEAITPSGMKTRIHKHAGPEAFYMLAGSQCVQTASGNAIAHAGDSSLTPGETPMTLAGIGNGMRRAIVLVLHATGKPWMTMVEDWTPTAPCASS